MTEILIGDMSPGSTLHKGNYGETFIKALAAAADLNSAKEDIDRCGIDWIFTFAGSNGRHQYPKVEAQVKAWHEPVEDSSSWKYSLKVKYFNKLAGRAWQIPRFLFIVIAPSDPEEWVDVDHDSLVLRRAGYWASLMDEDPIDGQHPDTKHMVRVPKVNLLTPDSFRSLFHPSWSERLAS